MTVFIRMSGTQKRQGQHLISPKSPGEYRAYSEVYPLDEGKVSENRHMEGDHIYEYVGTITKVVKATKKIAKPFVVGQLYMIKNSSPTRRYKFCGIFEGRALWAKEAGTHSYYITNADGTAVSAGMIGFVPEYDEVADGFEYKLVKED